MSYSAVQDEPSLGEKYAALDLTTIEEFIIPGLPASAQDTFSTYGLIPLASLPSLLDATLTAYASSCTSAPPIWSQTRDLADGCEICERSWVPLTYHHLIPRQTHERVRKRGWHEEWMLGSVAWLCRACHSYVHRVASNEELAREYYTVERLMERADICKWAGWAGRVRWKSR